jgi:hypothetical protein
VTGYVPFAGIPDCQYRDFWIPRVQEVYINFTGLIGIKINKIKKGTVMMRGSGVG